MATTVDFSRLSPEDKLAARLDAWLAAEHICFESPQAKLAYQEKVLRLINVIRLKKPDRVPAAPVLGTFPAFYAGITIREALYDYEKMALANRKYVMDFDPDVNAMGSGFVPGKALELLDYRLVKWAGHGVKDNTPYQYLEAEYMRADEYDDLIRDPSAFMMQKYLGRICKKLEPLQKIPDLFYTQEIVPLAASLPAFGDPDLQDALKALMEAGNEAARWSKVRSACIQQSTVAGYPVLDGGYSKAPFDLIGDTLRGTIGVMKDMYRQPHKLIQAMERLIPLMIGLGTAGVRWGGSPLISIPLHKGADIFMSDEQFQKFYWPSLKAVLLGLIHEGLVPRLFAEGGFNARLEVIRELPPGCTIWFFDKTDMVKAKAALGRTACIMGNIPASLLVTGSSGAVQKYCLNLIDTVGKDGGFILSAGSVLDEARPENVRMMLETARKYGRY
jgi:uroporphyrinogen-III decarboxylase